MLSDRMCVRAHETVLHWYVRAQAQAQFMSITAY